MQNKCEIHVQSIPSTPANRPHLRAIDAHRAHVTTPRAFLRALSSPPRDDATRRDGECRTMARARKFQRTRRRRSSRPKRVRAFVIDSVYRWMRRRSTLCIDGCKDDDDDDDRVQNCAASARRGGSRARVRRSMAVMECEAMDIDATHASSRANGASHAKARAQGQGHSNSSSCTAAGGRESLATATVTDATAMDATATTSKYRASQTLEEHVNKKINAAKRRTRSELSVSGGDWCKRGYAYDGEATDVRHLKHLSAIERISVKDMTRDEFVERFEKTRTPCVITDAMEGWACYDESSPRYWSVDNLTRRFRDVKFKVGSDDDGYAVRLKMKHIQRYLNDPVHTRDDSPMYAFDGNVFDRESTRDLLDDFTIPDWFKEDLFQYVGHKRRPPYRWIVFGPPRSGSSVHIDPLATSAWNALISGRKRWALYPPGTMDKPTIKPRGIGLDGESVTWFNVMYPLTVTEEWKSKGLPPPIDVIQHPGEIMFVPDGWWHAVLNLDHTMAVTQNFSTSARFDAVWRITHRARPKMSLKWLAKLRVARPDLAAVADAQPRRSELSAGEKTSSTSSSSEGSSDTE